MPQPSRVVESIFAHALTSPNSIALVDDQQHVTYADLTRRVTAVAHGLLATGVTTGDRVGIAIPRSVDAVVAVLAVHLCRAAYVPIDTDQPTSRLGTIVEVADVGLIIVPEASAPVSWNETCQTVEFAALCVAQPGASDALVFPEGDGADSAYVIFTSGTTGAPKGVEIDHSNLDALLMAWDTIMGVKKHTSLWLSALSFDASVAEIFWPLHAGGTLAISPPNRSSVGLADDVGSFICTHTITHVQCTPTRAKLLLADPNDRASLCRVEHFVIGGEALPSSVASELLEAGVQRLTNAYGPTEATVWAFTHEVTRASLDAAIVPLGLALPGVQSVIVDGAGYAVSAGEIGELILAGPFVSRGYVQRPELTAISFGKRTFGSVELQSYKTGDLVSLNVDGTMAFRGRCDGQVKLRGHRIELGEVEAILEAHSDVQDVIVVLDRRHVAATEEAQDLIAAVSVRSSEGTAPRALTRIKNDALVESLKEHLAARLPAIMVPRSIVLFESIPQTTSGKLDRVAVRESLGGERVRPAATESDDGLSALVEDFRIVLPTRAGHVITAESNFFDCGGHSLLVVELVERIARRTQISVPLSALLEASSPSELLHYLEAQSLREYSPIVHFSHSIEGLATHKRRRLFFIHGAGGHVLRFQSLAATLADEIELIGIQAIGVEGDQQPDRSLDEMADRYAEAIAAFDDGPYLLGGYSDGGILSVHVAQRLARRGGLVKGLIFVDSFRPAPFPNGLLEKAANVVHNAIHRDGLNVRSWAAGAMSGWRSRAQWDAEGAAALKRLGYNDVFAIIESAVQSSPKPGSVSAPALLIRTFAENPVRRRDYSVAYDAPSTTSVKWVNGKHDELFKEGSTIELSQYIRSFVVALPDV